MKKVAIDIDFVLRDWVTALITTYQKQIDDTWNEEIKDLDKIWEYFKFPVYTLSEGMTEDPDVMEHITVVDESKDYEVNRNLFNNFVADNLLEIFGHAKETIPNGMLQINRLRIEQPEWQVTLFAKGKGKLIPATLFFLSKVACEIKDIKFIDHYFDLKEFDTVVSGSTQLAEVPELGEYVLFATPYNEEEKGYNTKITTITELYGLQ